MPTTKVTINGKEKNLFVDKWLLGKINNTWLPQIKRDDDFVAVVDGEERSGKSTFAQQLAILFDPDFNLKNICMSPDEFKKRISEAKRGEAIVYDEAFTGLSSKGALSAVNKVLVEQMMEMGQKNLKVIIVLPTFFLLDKYVALFRSQCLFHVYKKRGERGYWMYFGPKRKKMLYIMGKKLLSYKEPKSKRRGRFLNLYCVNEQEYRDKKTRSFHNKDRSIGKDKYMFQRDFLMWLLTTELGIEQFTLAELMEISGAGLDQGMISKASKKIDARLKEQNEELPNNDSLIAVIETINKRNRLIREQKTKERLEKQAEMSIKRREKVLKDSKLAAIAEK